LACVVVRVRSWGACLAAFAAITASIAATTATARPAFARLALGAYAFGASGVFRALGVALLARGAVWAWAGFVAFRSAFASTAPATALATLGARRALLAWCFSFGSQRQVFHFDAHRLAVLVQALALWAAFARACALAAATTAATAAALTTAAFATAFSTAFCASVRTGFATAGVAARAAAFATAPATATIAAAFAFTVTVATAMAPLFGFGRRCHHHGSWRAGGC